MADMGWTDHISAQEASEYGYWGEAIDAGVHGTVYEESVVMEMRDALIAALPVVKAANRLELDTLVFDMEQAILAAGMREYDE
jgi:hypothetical protein